MGGWRLVIGSIAVMAGFSTTLAGQTSPQDDPQWRGQHRDGAASAFSEPDTWPDALTRHWTVEVGDGYATPIIVWVDGLHVHPAG